MNRLGAIVLCGGRSSRMGRSKAWLPFGGEPLLRRVVRVVASVTELVVVVAAPDQELPELPEEVETARDPIEGQGPLRGLLSGLDSLAGRAEAVFLTSCDVPFLCPQFVEQMARLLGDHRAAVARVAGHLHFTSAVYRWDIRDVVADLLAADRRKLGLLVEHVATRIVTADELRAIDPDLESLVNVNTSSEYAAAVARLAEQELR